jgi:tRNA-dihydrouridine synthase B|tara:strand:- start:24353 stop:25384 length:1032 start_codon:yes stop_codon:yes gene_type:complete
MRLPWFQSDSFPLYLAPMAGFTDVIFRERCKRQGADVMVTEFVMANKFLDPRGAERAWETVDFSPEQRPMGVQIFGSELDKMAEASRRIVDRLQPDFIDINYGCPAPKVVDNCAGSSLLLDLPRLGAVAESVVKAVGEHTPVTAKIRLGWDDEKIVAVEACRRLEDVGIEAIAIHGRTKVQGYRGDANWERIEEAAEAVRVPVIGNGAVEGVALGEHLSRVKTAGKVRGLMIGRAALGYPWVFREIKTYLETGTLPPPPTMDERWEVLLEYCHALMSRPAHADRWNRLNWMRSRLKSFTKFMPGMRQLRAQFDKLTTYEELEALSHEHKKLYADLTALKPPSL